MRSTPLSANLYKIRIRHYSSGVGLPNNHPMPLHTTTCTRHVVKHRDNLQLKVPERLTTRGIPRFVSFLGNVSRIGGFPVNSHFDHRLSEIRPRWPRSFLAGENLSQGSPAIRLSLQRRASPARFRTNFPSGTRIVKTFHFPSWKVKVFTRCKLSKCR